MYGSGLKALAERARDLEGQPVRSALSIDAGVEWTPKQKAQVQQAKADADKRKAEARTEEQKESAEAGANAASSLAHGNLGGAVSGLLGRRASRTAEQKMESSMGSGSDAGSGRPMTIVTDVLSVSTGASGASFEPPAGYKKVVREMK